MKNYLTTQWKSLRAWSLVTWGRGRLGKAKVILAWYGLAVVVMAPVALLMPDVELELRPGRSNPALLCRQQQSFDEIIDAKDVTNQALAEKLRHQPEVLGRVITSDSYMRRDGWAFQQARIRKIAQGHCLEVTHGIPVKASWLDWQPSEDSKDTHPLGKKPKRMEVTYQGQRYWSYAGEWQRVTGKAVTAEDRAPLMVSRKSQSSEGSDHSAPPVVDEPQVQTRIQRRPVPPFSRTESYAQVRVVLLRDGWQPLISKDADECIEGDSRCEGRPEMQTCSGSGLAMCRFGWQRDGQQLMICTAGEEQAKFYSVCE